MEHTKDYLARHLEAAGLPEMATKARTGYYHDFLSPLPMPSIQLDKDLRAANTPAAEELRRRHHEGEFDASLFESHEWAKSPEGKATLGAFAAQCLTKTKKGK